MHYREREATRLRTKHQIPEVTVKEPSTVPYCSTPEGTISSFPLDPCSEIECPY